MHDLILVVDDNVDNRDLTRILLEFEGFAVQTAEDATQALRILGTDRPRLILMDVQMPGIDGLELTRRLRQDPSLNGVPIVAFSAYAMAAEMENAREAGCDGYITKPIDTRTFGNTVRAYLSPRDLTAGTGHRSASFRVDSMA